MEFKIDTGADVTVIPMSIFQSIPDTTLKPATKTLSGASSRTLNVKGQFMATLKYKDKEAAEEVYAVKRLNRSQLGRPAIEALGLVQRVNAVQTKTDIMKQFPKLFEGLGKLEKEYTIILRDNATPYAFVNTTSYCHPIVTYGCMVVVPKTDGSVRICVDLTRLNENVRRERHPLPAVEQALAQLAGARIFLKIDVLTSS